MMRWGAFGGWFLVISLVRWLFLAALVAGVVWWITGHKRSGESAGDSEALAILKRRLAAGEISEADYARLKELLK